MRAFRKEFHFFKNTMSRVAFLPVFRMSVLLMFNWDTDMSIAGYLSLYLIITENNEIYSTLTQLRGLDVSHQAPDLIKRMGADARYL